MIEDYQKAKKIGDRAYKKALSSGRSPYVPALDKILKERGEEAPSEIAVGLMEIPVHMVVGTKTEGRQNSFAENFMPILADSSEFAAKWANLIDYQMSEGIQDAIKVYEYMQLFYVQEGNKRVSVMKYLDVPDILADVTRIMPKKTDELQNRIYYEFVDFFSVCPIYEITFSQQGGYQKLAEVMGQSLTEPWSEEAVKNLKAAYLRFAESYLAKGGKDLKMTVADALLVYLDIYTMENLMDESASVLSKQMDRLWKEFITETEDEGAAVVEKPEEAPPSAGLFDIIRKKPQFSTDKPMRIAFIYNKNPGNSRWIYGHELGRNYLTDKFGGIVETIKFEDCSDDEKLRHAIDAAASDNDDMIITVSPSQMAETFKAAIHYPKIKFMNCSINLSRSAVRTYYSRTYEAKFLMGALAASVCENHQIGYLADYPIYGSAANINAFAIGAALIDPNVKIVLCWSSALNSDWREEMRKSSVRVFSGPDLIKPDEASREYGIYAVGESGDVVNLAAPLWHWGRYYELIVNSILDGSWEKKKGKAQSYWWGMSSGVIDVFISKKLSYNGVKLVQILKDALINGSFTPFDGELRSQSGIIKRDGDMRLSNEDIIKMNWLCENVVGSIPSIDELVDDAKKVVRVSGINVDAAALREEDVAER